MSRDQSAKRNKGAAQLATTEKLQRNMWFSPLCQVMLNPNQFYILLKWSESPWKISPLAVKSQTTQIEVKDKTMMSAPEIFISPELF